jgi:hypothetical protein
MTGVEIIHAPRHGCSPIVIWSTIRLGIFRPVANSRIALLHCAAGSPSCGAELAFGWKLWQSCRALENATQSSSFVMIEAMTGYRDLSPISVKYIRASAKRPERSSKN